MINIFKTINFKLNTLVLILSLFSYVCSYASTTGIGEKRLSSGFICKKGVSLKILKETSLLIKSNVHLETNISGLGEMVLSGDDSVFLFAKRAKIENLIIQTHGNVNLQSSLEIVSSLQIHSGKLLLNSFSLILYPETKFDNLTIRHIVCSSKGRILYKRELRLLFSQVLKNINTFDYASMLPILPKHSLWVIFQANCSDWLYYPDAKISPPIPPPKIFIKIS